MWKKKPMTDVQLNKELTEGLHYCMHKCAVVNSAYSIDKLNKLLPIYAELGQDLVIKGNEEKHNDEKGTDEKYSDNVHSNKSKQPKHLNKSLSVSTSILDKPSTLHPQSTEHINETNVTTNNSDWLFLDNNN
jgi:hypothetical protein